MPTVRALEEFAALKLVGFVVGTDRADEAVSPLRCFQVLGTRCFVREVGMEVCLGADRG